MKKWLIIYGSYRQEVVEAEDFWELRDNVNNTDDVIAVVRLDESNFWIAPLVN